MKQVSKDHASFLCDTCDFLRNIQNIENLPDNVILATVDVTGLYTHCHGSDPDYADIFMAVIDKLIIEAAASHGEGVFPIRLMKRFLDDLFCGHLRSTVVHCRLPHLSLLGRKMMSVN